MFRCTTLPHGRQKQYCPTTSLTTYIFTPVLPTISSVKLRLRYPTTYTFYSSVSRLVSLVSCLLFRVMRFMYSL